MLTAAEIVDQAVSDRVVVIGSLPPGGHDLDIVARPAQVQQVAAALQRHGYARVGSSFGCFARGAADVVELVDIDSWHLRQGAAGRLFLDAEVLAGFRRVCAPSPHHQLLLTARRAARQGASLPETATARARAALAALPLAEAISDDWGARRSLRLLVRVCQGQRPTWLGRWHALADEPGQTRVHAARRLRPRRAPAVVIAFSGLDGAGKTTQIHELSQRLESVGIRTARMWTRLSFNPRLWRLGRAVKHILPARAGANAIPEAVVDDSRLDDPGRRFRAAHPSVTWLWALIVAAENGRACGRRIRAARRDGRVVLADRYHLDSAVHLRYRYGEQAQFGLPRKLIAALSPAPLLTFYLRMPPDAAAHRKQDQYSITQLRRQAFLYDAEAPAASAVVLDATLPQEHLSDLIAAHTWVTHRLGHRPPDLRRAAAERPQLQAARSNS